MENNKQLYKFEIAKYLGVSSDSVFLFNKGRVALYTILKVYDIKDGDEVIIPAFTCVVVPNAIIYCNAKPIYVDIDAKSYNIDTSLIEAKITSKTKAIIAQNTFGLAPDLNELKRIADKHNLILIEDCTHGFGGSYFGMKNGTIADASFFSTQWNKPFSTGLGGFAIVTDDRIRVKFEALSSHLVTPSKKEEIMLSLLITARKYFLKPFIYFQLVKLYRLLSKLNIVQGSSSGIELESTNMPNNYLTGSGNVQAIVGVKSIRKIDQANQDRRISAKIYNELFENLGFPTINIPVSENHIFLKYSILVNNRKWVFEQAEKFKVELGEWFISPIHPIEEHFEKWFYTYGENSIAEYASKHIINLPIIASVNEAYRKRIINFIEAIKPELIVP